MSITQATSPTHIAMIMDGNGRWATTRGMSRTEGHKKGADALKTTLEACRDAGVNYLTVYAFSSENWNRPAEEVGDLMSLLRLYLKKEIKTLHKNGTRLRFIGDRTKLQPDICELIDHAQSLTTDNTRFHLTIALSYGSRQELVHAVRQLIGDGLQAEQINERAIEDALYTTDLPELDLLIRTGGEQRLSNFLLWQSAYTELYFTDTLWPDFGAEPLQHALQAYAKRERRYGNTSSQSAC